MKRLLQIFLIIVVLMSQSALTVMAAAEKFSIEKALSANPKDMPNLRDFDYSKEYFKLRILTPLSGYRYALENKEKTIYQKHKRKKKDPYSLKDEDLDEIKFWNYRDPYVTVLVLPQPQTKNIVKAGRFVGYTTAAAFTIFTFGIGMATLGLPHKISGYKVSKDFYDMEVVDAKTKEFVCASIDKQIIVMDQTAQQYFFPDDHFAHFIGKLMLGVYKFKPECFQGDQKTKLVIWDEKDKTVLNFGIPNKLKKSIKADYTLGTTGGIYEDI